MAIGRVSPFSKIDRPTPGIQGMNLPGTALADPFTSLDAPRDNYVGGSYSDAPSTGVSPVTGMTSQANTAVGHGVNLAGMGFGIPSLGGLLSGLAGVPAPYGGFVGTAINSLGGKLGIPTSMGDVAKMGLDALMATGRFPLAVNPQANPQATFASTGLNQGQIAQAMSNAVTSGQAPFGSDPTTPFGLANIAPADLASQPLGAFGARGFGGLGSSDAATPADMGFVAANPSGSGNVGAPPGGFVDAQGNISNATTSFGIPDSSNFFGADAPGNVGGTPGGAGGSAVGVGGIGAGSATSGVPGGSVVGDATGVGPAGDGNGDGGTAGDGPSGGGGDAMHDGGFVGLEEGMGGDTKNSPDEGTKEVDATLEQGEFVVNKEAAGRFGPLLEKLNNVGRNKQLQEVLGHILKGAVETGFKALGR